MEKCERMFIALIFSLSSQNACECHWSHPAHVCWIRTLKLQSGVTEVTRRSPAGHRQEAMDGEMDGHGLIYIKEKKYSMSLRDQLGTYKTNSTNLITVNSSGRCDNCTLFFNLVHNFSFF